MSGSPKRDGTRMIPTLRYRDAMAAIDWLCDAFGFERRLVVPNESGGVAHAQLVRGDLMIMLGSGQDGDYDRLIRHPGEAGGVTQAPYIVVDDPDAVYGGAKGAGAEIVMEIDDWDHGGRGFSCRDPEGHVWNFGSYDPWAG